MFSYTYLNLYIYLYVWFVVFIVGCNLLFSFFSFGFFFFPFRFSSVLKVVQHGWNVADDVVYKKMQLPVTVDGSNEIEYLFHENDKKKELFILD